MSSTTLIIILGFAELVMIALVLVVIWLLRRKNNNNNNDKQNNDIPVIQQKSESTLLSEYIQMQIDDTHAFVNNTDEAQARILKQRIAFLESELLSSNENSENSSTSEKYWVNICLRLSSILTFDTNQTDTESTESVGAVSQSEQEIGRLRGIISKQHGAIEELKGNLVEAEPDLKKSVEILAQLEEVEVAHAQLNISVNFLEQENKRLKLMLNGDSTNTTENDDQDELHEIPDFDLGDDAGSELQQAQNRIEVLETENTASQAKITELEQEVGTLETQLEEKVEELNRVQSLEVDLSADLSLLEGSDDPEILTKQIEELTELLVKKSEELSDLQTQNTETAAENPTLDDETDLSPPMTNAG